ncbi:L-threonylcarbamoyladenylate synthase [Syntrophomonas curvata]
MNTAYWRVNPQNPDPEVIKKAAELLREQKLVAFPTETVYGLGALANSSQAVAGIFTAKGRPARNPLLVHISKIAQLEGLVEAIPDTARLLMDKFWPGPLSIILPARNKVPDIVRGGRNTVGLRMPAHPVALALIDEAGPVAAPSANLSGRPSPLSAEHVKADLDGKIAAVLDAGSTGIGLESTLLDLSTERYKVLRLGGLPLEDLQQLLGDRLETTGNDSDRLPHYQTTYEILICDDHEDFIKRQEYCRQHKKKFAIVSSHTGHQHIINKSVAVYQLSLNQNSSNLYAILRQAEQAGIEILLFSPLPEDLHQVNPTLFDRIRRASGKQF